MHIYSHSVTFGFHTKILEPHIVGYQLPLARIFSRKTETEARLPS